MPQGKFKPPSSSIPHKKSSNLHKKGKKACQKKKGGRTIAPKKTKAVEGAMMQKTIQKAINKGIEAEMMQRARGKSFAMLGASTSSDPGSATTK